MTKPKGKAKRTFNNMTMKRPSEKNRRQKEAIKLHNTRKQSNLKSFKVLRQRQKEHY